MHSPSKIRALSGPIKKGPPRTTGPLACRASPAVGMLGKHEPTSRPQLYRMHPITQSTTPNLRGATSSLTWSVSVRAHASIRKSWLWALQFLSEPQTKTPTLCGESRGVVASCRRSDHARMRIRPSAAPRGDSVVIGIRMCIRNVMFTYIVAAGSHRK